MTQKTNKKNQTNTSNIHIAIDVKLKQRMDAFRTYIIRWHQEHGRHSLPWRGDFNPYHVMVSEMMLQQTQVSRVLPKFEQFVKEFPTVRDLAAAAPSDVIKLWQGLGYNRRGLYLHRAAAAITTTHNGIIPDTYESLIKLPGIGDYTANAILAFSYQRPVIVIETNIRTVFLYHFFPQATYKSITDAELLPLFQQALWRENPRIWYAALMDYGSHLKSVIPNPTKKSRQYAKQSKFDGSFRQIRGSILRVLTKQTIENNSFDQLRIATETDLNKTMQVADFEKAIIALEKESFITYNTQTKIITLKT